MKIEQLVKWIKRLIEINKSVKNEQDQDVKIQRVNQLVGYIESLENIPLD